MNRRLLILTTAMLLTVIATAACGAGNSRQEMKTHSRDGLLGITDVNPNMPLSKTYPTYTDDARMMEAAVKEKFPTVNSTSVTFNGAVAHIRINVPVGTAPEEMARIKREATALLAANAPRYNVDVEVSAK